MKRLKFIFIILLSFSLFSCSTTKKDEKALLEEQRERDALCLLFSDMSSLVADASIDKEKLEGAIKEEYEVYSLYLPQYKELKDEYLEEVATLFPLCIPTFSAVINNNLNSILSSPSEYVEGNQSFVRALRDNFYPYVYNAALSRLEINSDKLSLFFSKSEKIFLEIRDAYLNLENVGVSFSLPLPLPLDNEYIATAFCNEYFALLEKNEEFLKNIEPQEDSLYLVFWKN